MGSRFALSALGLCACAVFFCAPVARGGAGLFFSDVTDATLGAEIRFKRSAFHFGGTVADLNNDGLPDVAYHRIFWNNGDGTFRVTELPGAPPEDELATVTAADVDGDGWIDLLNNGRLYRNDADGGFTLLPGYVPVALRGAGWGDYDLDGDLDLLLAGGYQGGQAMLENTPAGFVDRWEQRRAEVYSPAPTPWVPFTPRVIDLDQDGLPDILWVNDHGRSEFWRQTSLGVFENVTDAFGFGVSESEMGCDVDDIDNDGDWDVVIQDIYGGVLYFNHGAAGFDEAAFQAGVRRYGWGWGVSFMDLDNDGLLDFVGVGQMTQFFGAPDSGVRAWRQIPGAGATPRFEYVTPSAGLQHRADAFGLSEFDMDADGDLDLLVYGRWMFRNELPPDTHWLRVELETSAEPSIPPNGLGSIVRARIGARELMRRVDGGGNYRSQSESIAHFGLGADTVVDELRVEWTNGDITTLRNIAADQTLLIRARSLDCAADISGNGRIDLADVALLLQSFGAVESDAWFDERADLARDGGVNLRDLAELLARWNNECHPPAAERPAPLAIAAPTDAGAGRPAEIVWTDSKPRAHQIEAITAWRDQTFDFEDPNQTPLDFDADTGWISTTADAVSGTRSFRSGAVAQSQASLVISGPARVRFFVRTEATAEDRLAIRVDGVLRREISGDTAWSAEEIVVEGGEHALSWTFNDADLAQSFGINAALIDDLQIRQAEWTPIDGMALLNETQPAFVADFESGAWDARLRADSPAWSIAGNTMDGGYLRSPALAQNERAQLAMRAPVAGALRFRYRTLGDGAQASVIATSTQTLPQSTDWREVVFAVPQGSANVFWRVFNAGDQLVTLEIDDIDYAPHAPADAEDAIDPGVNQTQWTPTAPGAECMLRIRARRPEGTWGPWNFSPPFEVAE